MIARIGPVNRGRRHRLHQRQRLPQSADPGRQHQRPASPGGDARPASRRSAQPSRAAATSTPRPRPSPSACSAHRPPGCSASTACTPACASGSAACGSTSPASSRPPRSRPRSTVPCSSAFQPRSATSASTVTRPRSTSAPSPARPPPSSRCSRRPPTPSRPNEVDVSQPSAALTARADAQGALNGLFLGLGAVSLLVGAVGVAQHHDHLACSSAASRSACDARSAPPRATSARSSWRKRFCSRCSAAPSASALGALATAVYAHTKHWTTVIPTLAWAGGLGAAFVIGAIAGLLPAIRAARLSPTDALRTV